MKIFDNLSFHTGKQSTALLNALRYRIFSPVEAMCLSRVLYSTLMHKVTVNFSDFHVYIDRNGARRLTETITQHFPFYDGELDMPINMASASYNLMCEYFLRLIAYGTMQSMNTPELFIQVDAAELINCSCTWDSMPIAQAMDTLPGMGIAIIERRLYREILGARAGLNGTTHSIARTTAQQYNPPTMVALNAVRGNDASYQSRLGNIEHILLDTSPQQYSNTTVREQEESVILSFMDRVPAALQRELTRLYTENTRPNQQPTLHDYGTV